jgi:8-amino-7-oxononanoate synthase
MSLPIEAADGVHVTVAGRRLVSFAGCDSLGLARHPAVVDAARRSLAACGLGAAASRTTTGTWTPHLDLERALAAWMGDDDCVLLASGWVAGTALAAALAPETDVVLLDAGAHPALRDAATLTGLPVREFAHFDARGASRAVHGGRPLVLTDAVDVTRGALAPLAALRRLVERTKGHLVADDAHGVGVLGDRGRGAAAAARALGPRVHVAGSLSKALGAHGGFVTGPRALCDDIRTRFTGYSGGTPIPPSTAAAAAVAVRLASEGDDLRRRLRANAALLRRRFVAMGLATPRAGLPWFSVAGRPARELKSAETALRRAGFLVPYLRYFGAPPEGFLKIAVTAAHETAHVEGLADALATQIGRGSSGPRVPR